MSIVNSTQKSSEHSHTKRFFLSCFQRFNQPISTEAKRKEALRSNERKKKKLNKDSTLQNLIYRRQLHHLTPGRTVHGPRAARLYDEQSFVRSKNKVDIFFFRLIYFLLLKTVNVFFLSLKRKMRLLARGEQIYIYNIGIGLFF